MANTYTLIASSTVGSGGTATIDFTSIPATYTDLLLKISSRGDRTSATFDGIYVKFNTSSTATTIYFEGNGASASAGPSGNFAGIASATTATSNTFSNVEMYIPNYTVSQNKSYNSDSAHETNATTAYIDLIAGLWASTAVINQITLNLNAGNFVQYSTAYLYGISNA
jgi:hypothetical protein